MSGRNAPRLAGTVAAAVTPFRDGGAVLDEEAFAPLDAFYEEVGLDGVLINGTTGEGMLLSPAERRRAAELAVEASGGLATIVHAGAQSTADTVALAAHAAECGADAVAVIGPPYFAYDERELLAHFVAAAGACAPVPFYLYEFAARSGYAVPPALILRLGELAPNLTGLKVSDAPWDRFALYLIDGLDVFAGPEGLIHQALEHGAVGAVLGLAAGFPEEVIEAVTSASVQASDAVGALRARVSALPFQSALKTALGWRGVPIGADARAPLRALDGEERERLRAELERRVAR
jgi:dihydrodipicolinate synthase/N-acetylneuraminate lyase